MRTLSPVTFGSFVSVTDSLGWHPIAPSASTPKSVYREFFIFIGLVRYRRRRCGQLLDRQRGYFRDCDSRGAGEKITPRLKYRDLAERGGCVRKKGRRSDRECVLLSAIPGQTRLCGGPPARPGHPGASHCEVVFGRDSCLDPAF